MRVENAKERIYLTEEETAVLQRTDEILHDMYQRVTEGGELEHLLEEMTSDFQEFWETDDDFEVFPADTPAPKTIKIDIELH